MCGLRELILCHLVVGKELGMGAEELEALRAAPTPSHDSNAGENAMQRILIPVDGSRNSEFAVRHVINSFLADSNKEVHLLNVQPPLSRHVAQGPELAAKLAGMTKLVDGAVQKIGRAVV